MLNIKTNLNISSIKRISYRKDLNGLRALSVLAVVFYHSDIEVFKGGWLGVDIFFVISGYLISNIIVSELNSNTFSFKKFYIRRIRRIIPALFSFISTSTFFAYWLLTPKAIVEYVNSVTASIFFYANYYFQNLDFYTSESLKLNPTIHTWSLAIEEQFYLVFPLIAVIFYRYFKKYFFINFVVLFFFSIFLNSLTQDIVKFYQLQYRAWEILFGVIIMILRSKFKFKSLNSLGIFIVLFSIYYFDDSLINNIEPKLMALVGVSLIILGNSNNSHLSRIFDSKFINIIGLSSYSIYLFHQPVFAFYRVYKLQSWNHYINLTTEINNLEKIVLICISILIGSLNYFVVEKRFLNKKKFSRELIVVFIILLISIFSLEKIYLKKSNLSVIPEKVITYTIQNESQSIYKNNERCHNRPLNKTCIFSNSSDLDVYLIGDSHLQNLQTLAFQAPNFNYNLHIYTHGGCMFVFEKKFRNSDCPNVNKANLDFTLKNIKDSVIIYGGRLPLHISEERFFNGYVLEPGNYEKSNFKTFNEKKVYIQNTLEKFLKNNNYLILIYPIPEQAWNVPSLYLNGTLSWKENLSYPSEIFYKRVEDSFKILDSINGPNVFRVYPDKIFCNTFIPEQCVAKFEEDVFYYDDDHLSLDGEKLISDSILNFIKKIKF